MFFSKKVFTLGIHSAHDQIVNPLNKVYLRFLGNLRLTFSVSPTNMADSAHDVGLGEGHAFDSLQLSLFDINVEKARVLGKVSIVHI